MSAILSGIGRMLDVAGVGTFDEDGTAIPDPDVGITLLAVPSSPQRIVCLTTYPGIPDDDHNGWRYPRMQVRVRGDRDTRTALDLDEAAYQALQATGPHTLGGGFWLVDCHALQSSAQPLGQDDTGAWELTRNYQLSIEQEQ